MGEVRGREMGREGRKMGKEGRKMGKEGKEEEKKAEAENESVNLFCSSNSLSSSSCFPSPCSSLTFSSRFVSELLICLTKIQKEQVK